MDKNTTVANEWKRDFNEGIEVTMPHNGRTVRIRSISVLYLVRTGKMPDGLTALALGAANLDISADDSPDKLIDFNNKLDEYYRAICTEALVYPRVVEKPVKDDEIAYEWLTEHDKQFIDAILQRPVGEWRSFRHESLADVESVSNGKSKQHSTKSTATHS